MPLKVLPNTDRLPEPLRRFIDRMSVEQRLLLVLKRELYDGDWAPMVMDLTHRLEGRPYVLRLANRVSDDLQRIEQMRQMEAHYEVDLSAYVESLEQLEAG
jgi:hypothetical protein